MKRFWVLAAAVLLIGVTTGSSALAGGDSVVGEAVVTTLSPDGAVRESIVSQLVHLDTTGSETVELRIPDVAELDSYRNLSGFSGPSSSGDELVWRTSDRLDAHALASGDVDLPLDVRVRYFLDGEEMSADDIEGEEGEVRIEVELVNQTGSPETLVHRGVTSPFLTSTVNTYIPIEFSIRAQFPNERWTDVGGDQIFVQPGSGEQLAVASGILSPPVTSDRVSFGFEASSDDVLTPRIQVFAIPRMSPLVLASLQEQFEALTALYGGVGSISDNLDTIYRGTVELVTGVEELLAGVGARDPDTGQPIITLEGGKPTTLLGTIGFLSAALRGDVLGGIGERDPVTGEGIVTKDSKGSPDTLIGSLQSSIDNYDEDLIPGMDKLIAGMDELIAGLGAGGPELIDGLKTMESAVGEILAGLQTNDPAEPGVVEGLEQLSAGLGGLIDKLDEHPAVDAEPPLPPSAPTDFIEGLGAVELIGTTLRDVLGIDPVVAPGDPGLVTQLLSVVDGLQTGLGSRDPVTGAANLNLDPVTGQPLDVLSALAVMAGGLDGAILPGLDQIVGGLGAVEGGLAAAGAGTQELVGTVLGALGQMRVGLTNPAFTEPHAALDGMSPKAYLQECPGCFDPDHELFDPVTLDPAFQPGFRDVFVLFSEGLKAGLVELQSFDADAPGLVDGLTQITDGLDALGLALHTFDPADPGLVDGLGLARGGLTQVSTGMFALNELGVGILQGQLGEGGNEIARDQAALREGADGVKDRSALGAAADLVYTTYVYEIVPQSTATRDNLIRVSLIAMAFGLAGLLAGRPRMAV